MVEKVLVVDDEATMLDLLEIILGQEGYRVTRAASGEEAVRLLEDEDFDLVITDLHLGKINGLTVISAAKQNSPDTIAIMITGCCDESYRTAAYRSEADDYLLKPLSLDDLLGSIHLHESNPVYQIGPTCQRAKKRLEVSA